MQVMTHDELGQAMINGGAGIWPAEKWAIFYSLSQSEQQAMAQIAQDSPNGPGVNGWTIALNVMTTTVTVVGDIVGLGSGIQAIQALVKTL